MADRPLRYTADRRATIHINCMACWFWMWWVDRSPASSLFSICPVSRLSRCPLRSMCESPYAGNDGWMMGALSGLPFSQRLDLLEIPGKVANQQVGQQIIQRNRTVKENPAMPVIDRRGELFVRGFVVTSARQCQKLFTTLMQRCQQAMHRFCRLDDRGTPE